MTKTIIALVLLFAGLGCFGQHKLLPILLPKKSGVNYSISEVRKFTGNGTNLASNWIDGCLNIVDSIMHKHGRPEGSKLTTKMILDSVKYQKVRIQNFRNSGHTKTGDTIKFFIDTVLWDGKGAIFHYIDVAIILFRPSCVNLNGIDISGIVPTPVGDTGTIIQVPPTVAPDTTKKPGSNPGNTSNPTNGNGNGNNNTKKVLPHIDVKEWNPSGGGCGTPPRRYESIYDRMGNRFTRIWERDDKGKWHVIKIELATPARNIYGPPERCRVAPYVPVRYVRRYYR